jgi:hypothetical protein
MINTTSVPLVKKSNLFHVRIMQGDPQTISPVQFWNQTLRAVNMFSINSLYIFPNIDDIFLNDDIDNIFSNENIDDIFLYENIDFCCMFFSR